MVNKLSQTIIDFNKLDKKNIKTIKIGDEIIGPDENGQVILNGNTGGTTGGTAGGTTGGGTTQNPASQLPSTVNLFSGSAVGNILLSGPTPDYSNIQDGLLITLSNLTSVTPDGVYGDVRMDLSSAGLKPIKIPKENLVINSSFDISDQLSQYIGKTVHLQSIVPGHNDLSDFNDNVSSSILSFEGTTIKVLPNTTLGINLIVTAQINSSISKSTHQAAFPIPVIRVNAYKN